ncbi:MAG TPA: SapC family protein [Terriglobia bacterium]|nr:SapC family protein [Terriglobia bacterium]HEU5133550.1 SapC family protein [Steroidobacteraceae bacterium]
MPRHALLNNIEHKDLRVVLRYGAEFGDDVATLMTFPTEYSDVQREYPIFFRKDSVTGEYQSIVLLGFEKGENLFLDSGRWDAHYVPGMVARGPFLIGFQERLVDGEMRKEPVIHVDLDNPRVSFTEGRPVFLPAGGNSPYLNLIAGVLRGIHEGIAVSKAMFAAFTALDLIEPVKLEVKLDDEETFNLAGLHTISQEKLRAIDSESLFQLHRSGFLEGAFLALASVKNVGKLMAMKRRRNQTATEDNSASH